MNPPMRFLVVADNWSMKMGGESSFPMTYTRLFEERGATVWMVVHARVRSELLAAFPESVERMRFIEDSPAMLRLGRLGRFFPSRLREMIINMFISMLTQRRARQLVREVIREYGIEVVFQPTPISPRSVSYMYDLGVPVVIGPMCGGMNFPPAFRDLDSWFTRVSMALGRRLSLLRTARRGSSRLKCCWSPTNGRPRPCHPDAGAA